MLHATESLLSILSQLKGHDGTIALEVSSHLLPADRFLLQCCDATMPSIGKHFG